MCFFLAVASNQCALTILFAHNSTVRCMAKHERYFVAIHFSVLNLLGLFVEYTFGRRLIFSKMREASPTSVISRKFGAQNHLFSACSVLPPPLPPQSHPNLGITTLHTKVTTSYVPWRVAYQPQRIMAFPLRRNSNFANKAKTSSALSRLS
jgi:hypothetical protein